MPFGSDPLRIITSNYNLAKSETRRDNFRAFREYLAALLLVIELARPGEHHLAADDGDIGSRRIFSLISNDLPRVWATA